MKIPRAHRLSKQELNIYMNNRSRAHLSYEEKLKSVVNFLNNTMEALTDNGEMWTVENLKAAL